MKGHWDLYKDYMLSSFLMVIPIILKNLNCIGVLQRGASEVREPSEIGSLN